MTVRKCRRHRRHFFAINVEALVFLGNEGLDLCNDFLHIVTLRKSIFLYKKTEKLLSKVPKELLRISFKEK